MAKFLFSIFLVLSIFCNPLGVAIIKFVVVYCCCYLFVVYCFVVICLLLFICFCFFYSHMEFIPGYLDMTQHIDIQIYS